MEMQPFDFSAFGEKIRIHIAIQNDWRFFPRIHHTTQKREFICDLPWISARICQMHII